MEVVQALGSSPYTNARERSSGWTHWGWSGSYLPWNESPGVRGCTPNVRTEKILRQPGQKEMDPKNQGLLSDQRQRADDCQEECKEDQGEDDAAEDNGHDDCDGRPGTGYFMQLAYTNHAEDD